MSADDRFRVFRIPYRKAERGLLRDDRVECDAIIKAGYQPGEVWSRSDGAKIWVNVIVPYFDPPASEQEKESVDRLFEECESRADRWVHENFPGQPILHEAM